MKVKLINKEITSNFIPELLKERDINDVEHFLNPTEQDLQTFKDLVNIDKGVQLINKTIDNELPYALIVD